MVVVMLSSMWRVYLVVLVATSALLAAGAPATDNVTVVERITVSFEEYVSLEVDATREYILEFVPRGDEGSWPARLWVSSTGGDAARPLLLTARQRTGATTWQVPYSVEGRLLYEFERTLCPEDSDAGGADDSDCVDEATAAVAGAWSLHVASWCARAVHVRLRARAARDWRLHLLQPATHHATLAGPVVMYYQFSAGEESVRLLVSSTDDACATVAVQNYTCPIGETLANLDMTTLKMTVQRSGGTQLSASRFPLGFYVIAVVHESERECSGEERVEQDWLWDAVLDPAAAAQAQADRDLQALARRKELTFTIVPALTRTEYLVGVATTVGVFLAFYVAFGALVAAQRWPAWRRLVEPHAVLLDDNKTENGERETDITSDAPDTPGAGGPAGRRRRDSTATFDSSDNSDTDDEEPAITTTTLPAPVVSTISPHVEMVVGAVGAVGAVGPLTNNNGHVAINGVADTATGHNREQEGREGQARPFGLPVRLHVAALSRRGARVLEARSDRYLHTLYTVAVFYALPVVQFVTAFQIFLNLSGSLDMCYYNFLCAHPAGALSDFNHVFSNLGYLLLGALFMLQLRRRKMRRRRNPKDEEYGIPAHYGLLSSLGAGMMVVALLSASYHICPNKLNFQFDTAFMYVLAVLSMVKIYQSRHPDINARAHATFGVLAVLIALVVWGVLGGGPLFWALFTVAHLFTFLLLSLRIYYVGQFRLEKECWQVAARAVAAVPTRGRDARPLYTARLVLLLIANAVNWAFALYGLLTQSGDFASHLLAVLLCNTLMHMLFYLSMKLLHGEHVRWYAWVFLGSAAAAAAWAPALYFFTAGSSSWSATPAHSRHLNHECRVLRFYDSHDLWHMLSAVALYLSFNAMLVWDDGLSAIKRTDIAVF